MGYDSKHVEIKSPQEGYNLIADEYGKYHKHLDSFDKGFFQRILPRKIDDMRIIDLGAGDGRMRKFFKDSPIKQYTACDISEKLLKKHPGTKKVEKIICDLEKELPFQDNSYELAISFFVLEHIDNIQGLLQEIYRILTPGGQRVIGHFLQRREFLWKKDKEIFKIELFNHRIQDIEKLAKENFFSVEIFPIAEKGTVIGYVISLRKD
ncbi:ubiquinone/menaquinone biosynthesis methyltransferase ubie [candidate division SR1 bacterium RAAC1_SR1_1]|nr:ubiquinone/menaquinone biosynthesis methyltransferase ubie [candidate division SR1 bacterium RAAC1_SR1_1]